MPALQTTQNVTGLTALTSGVNFTGLVVLAPGPGMDRVGCCDFAEECLILQVSEGQLTQAQLYRDGDPTSSGLTDITLPFTLPPTSGDEYYRLGYLAGNVVDRLANLPVQHCRDCFSYELTVPDQAALEIADFPDNSQIAGATDATINSLQTQVNQLLSNVDDLGAANNSLQAQLTASQTNLTSTQNDLNTASETLATTQGTLTEANTTIATLNEQLASLQTQIDTLTQANQDATAETTAADAVRSAIAALTLRDLSVCTSAQTVISGSTASTGTSSSTTTNETTQALTSGGGGKVVQLRPSIAKAGCDSSTGQGSSSTMASTNGSGSVPSAASSVTDGSGRILNFSTRNGKVISGCNNQKESVGPGCCSPGTSSSTSTGTAVPENTRDEIAKVLSGAQPFVPSVPPQIVCEEIEKEKQKLLVHPGCSDPQEISAKNDCDDDLV